MEVDFFDPRTWEPEEDCKRIWLDPNNGIFCIVDNVDYLWALQWTWKAVADKTGKKFYAVRQTRLHGAKGPQTTVYMHKVILERKGDRQPTEKHTIGDHLDGESLNNRRDNLRWATRSENNKNLYGVAARQSSMTV